jgi:hypothetical protein
MNPEQDMPPSDDWMRERRKPRKKDVALRADFREWVSVRRVLRVLFKGQSNVTRSAAMLDEYVKRMRIEERKLFTDAWKLLAHGRNEAGEKAFSGRAVEQMNAVVRRVHGELIQEQRRRAMLKAAPQAHEELGLAAGLFQNKARVLPAGVRSVGNYAENKTTIADMPDIHDQE